MDSQIIGSVHPDIPFVRRALEETCRTLAAEGMSVRVGRVRRRTPDGSAWLSGLAIVAQDLAAGVSPGVLPGP